MRFPFLLTASVLLLPTVTFAAAAGTFSQLVTGFVSYLNYGAVVLISLAIVIYFLGISQNLIKVNSGEASTNLRSYIMWGLIGIFFMVSIWGIVQLVQNTLFGNSAGSSAYSSQGL